MLALLWGSIVWIAIIASRAFLAFPELLGLLVASGNRISRPVVLARYFHLAIHAGTRTTATYFSISLSLGLYEH